jgi:integrase
MKLTVKSTEALKLAPGERDRIVFDETIPGWGLRLRKSGRRYWVLQYAVPSKGKHKTRRITFGTYPAMDVPTARQRAVEFHAKVKLGGDPQRDKADSKTGETFERCMRLYLERRRRDPKLRASSYREIERHLVRNLAPLHATLVHKLDRRAVALELSRLAEVGPVQANRTRASLVGFLNWAAREGLVDSNVATFTNRNVEAPRDRVLSVDELARIWLALPAGDFGDVVKLLGLTGQRREEIAQLRWSEVDLDRGLITLAPTRTKNRRPHAIPLVGKAREILAARWRDRDHGRALAFGRGQRRNSID